MDRTRVGATITSAITNQGTASVTFTTDIASNVAAGNLGYYQIGDVFQVNDSRTLGLVTAIGEAALFQTITASKIEDRSRILGVR